MNSESGSN